MCLVQTCFENGFKNLASFSRLTLAGEGGAAHAEMGEKAGMIGIPEFRWGTVGSAARLMRSGGTEHYSMEATRKHAGGDRETAMTNPRRKWVNRKIRCMRSR
jgi:hypothetical protein